MNLFLGKWKLKENINFDEFLKFCQYRWITRKIALKANIDLEIIKISEKEIKRVIKSTFFNSEEKYMLDNKFHVNKELLKKKHNFENNIIKKEIIRTIYNWEKEIYVKNNTLKIERYWKTYWKKKNKSIQIFIKN